MAYMEQSAMAGGQAPDAATKALLQIMALPNIADKLNDQKLGEISGKVVSEYEIDKKSRTAWEERIAKAMDLAMLVAEQKDYPFKNAANVKYPLLTTAALQFNARAYPAIVQGNRVVKSTIWGQDPQGMKAAKGDRVSEYMSYQLLAEMPEWEEDTDKLLVILPIVGCAFRKVYYDPSLKRNTTRLVTADRLVVNYFARSLEDCPRVTEEMRLYPYEIQERIRSGRFIEFDYKGVADSSDEKDKEKPDDQDDDAPQLFLEQHRLLDLDGDGYPEPYIVTVHHATAKVCRIVANFTEDSISIVDGKIAAIRKQQYYIKYLFLPSPDGGFYGWGFGWLLKDIGEAINGTLNMMLDAGHQANIQGGLVSAGLGIKEKKITLAPGEWRVLNTSVPLNQAVMPITYPGPAQSLFNLLGLLVEAGKDVAAIKDVLTGEGMGKNASPTTTMALIEQGLQVFTSIYKRIHRSLKAELGIHARLNRKHLDPEKYNRFFDGEEQFDPAQDFNEQDCDILPVSDPATVSKMQKLAKADFIYQTAKENPMVNPIEALKRVFEAADVEEVDKLIMPPPEPNPEEEILKRIISELALQKQEADISKTHADTLKAIADAEAAEEGPQIEAYMAYLSFLQQQLQAQLEGDESGQGGLPGMEGQPGDAMGAEAPVDESQFGGGGFEEQPVPLDGGNLGGMEQPASAGGI